MPITQDTRPAEALNTTALAPYLVQQLGSDYQLQSVRQFRSGYSNLTYLLEFTNTSLVLRRPPFGPRAANAHDMVREYQLLSALKPVFAKAPQPILLCETEEPTQLGAPFYLMEYIAGTMLSADRLKLTDAPSATSMATGSYALIDTLAQLHSIELTPELKQLGKPEGYVTRQVEGWVRRFAKAKTDDVNSADTVIDYLRTHQPVASSAGPAAAIVHNDYKFDNLIFADQSLSEVKAVLDWEMCTVGDAWMDLGLTLAYWAHDDEVAEMPFLGMNLTHLPGTLRRSDLVAAYAKTRRIPSNILFYYVFGNFKIAGIVQQIYSRYVAGHTQDARFAGLGAVVDYLLVRAERAMASGRIE